MCGCLSCAHYWGPGPQPRPVPQLGIEPVILWFTGAKSTEPHQPGLIFPFLGAIGKTTSLDQTGRHRPRNCYPLSMTGPLLTVKEENIMEMLRK